MGFSKPKPKGPSAEQIRLQKEQTKLAKQQQEQAKQQAADLKDQERTASVEAERSRQQRISGQKARRRRGKGRASLIATGSELGTSSSDTLG
jgi:hypothetical protein